MTSSTPNREASPTASRPQAPRRSNALLGLWAATAVGGLAQSLAGAAGALLAVQVAGSELVAGLPQALLVAGSAAAALGLSALATRRGRRASLATGACIAVAGCAVVTAGAVTDSLAGVLAGSLLLGAGNTAVMLARYAAADLATENTRAKAMASVLLATTLGAVVGPNLLAPSSNLSTQLGLPHLTGSYLLAGVAFAAAALAFVVKLPTPQITPPGPDSTAPRPAPVGSRTDEGLVRGRGSGLSGLVVLSVANVVMVAVMTMAPVQLHHLGHGLTVIGLIISAHIGAMFAPSLLSGWLTERLGAHRAATIAGGLLAAASTIAAVGAESLPVLGTAMVLLGAGWNLALVSGSVLLTAGVPPTQRHRREGWGEVGMGVAATGGGVAAGPLVASGGYPALAGAGALLALALLPAALARPRQRSTFQRQQH